MHKKLTSFAVFLGVGSLFLASCGGGHKKTTTKTPEEGIFKKSSSKPVPVLSSVVTFREIPLEIQNSGKLEASDRYEAKAPANVKIQKIFVELGARVQAGDPLVKFEDDLARLRLNKARAELKEGETGLNLFQYQQKNREQLEQENKISEVEAAGLDEHVAFYQALQERARAEIEYLEKFADLEQLNSPLTGLVSKKEATDGAEVSEDQVIVEVIRLDPIFFTFKMPMDDVTALEKSPEISVKLSSFPGQDFTGDLANVGSEAEEKSNLTTVKIRISNPDLVLKADLTGTVDIKTQAKKRVLVVPESALIRSDRANYVYKIDGGKVKRVVVDLGDPIGSIPTVEKGLSEGDLIVSSSDEDLKDGAVVEIQGAKAP